MNDDLHDIDHLFRDGIEGHEEDVPPSVWQGVSNDLDRKQASYYKSKYYRLKRAALLLLLLCFLGGVYLLYNKGGEKNNPSSQSGSSANTVSTASSHKTKNQRPLTPNKELGETKEGKEENQSPLLNDTASVSQSSQAPETSTKKTSNAIGQTPVAAEQPATKDGATSVGVERPAEASITTAVKKQRERGKNLATIASPITSPASTSVAKNTAPSKRVRLIEPGITKAGKENERSQSLIANRNPSINASVPQATEASSKVLALTSRQYNAQSINLRALPADNKNFLPQTEKSAASKNKTTHGFSLSAFAAPNLSFDRLEDDDRLAGPGRNRQEARKQEQDNFSFSAGLLLGYNLTKNITLQSGISLTSSSTSIASSTIYAKPDGNGRPRFELHCSSGFAYITPKSGATIAVGDSAKTSGTVSKLTYVTIPALVSFRINKGRFSFSPTVGAGLNFLTSGKTKTSLTNTPSDESATTSITGLKSTYVDGHLGFGVEYGLSKNISIGIRPNARLALTPINQETPVRSYPNFLSIETGVRIKL